MEGREIREQPEGDEETDSMPRRFGAHFERLRKRLAGELQDDETDADEP